MEGCRGGRSAIVQAGELETAPHTNSGKRAMAVPRRSRTNLRSLNSDLRPRHPVSKSPPSVGAQRDPPIHHLGPNLSFPLPQRHLGMPTLQHVRRGEVDRGEDDADDPERPRDIVRLDESGGDESKDGSAHSGASVDETGTENAMARVHRVRSVGGWAESVL